jgi:hypothetical protein
VGGVHEDIKSLIKGSRLYGSSKHNSKKRCSGLMLLLSPTWLVNLTLKTLIILA